jgi:hypothetical protein
VIRISSPGPSRRPPGLRDEVDRFGGTTREDDFLDAGGVEEAAHPLARALEGIGGALAELVDTPVDVGVAGTLVAVDGLDHCQRSLCRSCRIEEGKPLAAYVGGENGKVGAHLRDIIGLRGYRIRTRTRARIRIKHGVH